MSASRRRSQRILPRTVSTISAAPAADRSRWPRSLFDRWFEAWITQAEARWSTSGNLSRYY